MDVVRFHPSFTLIYCIMFPTYIVLLENENSILHWRSELLLFESSSAKLACPQGNEALRTHRHIGVIGSISTRTSVSSAQKASKVENPASETTLDDNEFHDDHTTGEESYGHVTGKGLVQSPHAEDELWEQMKSAMKEKLGGELRKERQLRQEQMQQTQQLKQQNQQLEERLRTEQTNVEQLKEEIKQSEQAKQRDKQKMMQMMDEMRVRLREQRQRIQQENQMTLQMLDGLREHLRGSL